MNKIDSDDLKILTNALKNTSNIIVDITNKLAELENKLDKLENVIKKNQHLNSKYESEQELYYNQNNKINSNIQLKNQNINNLSYLNNKNKITNIPNDDVISEFQIEHNTIDNKNKIDKLINSIIKKKKILNDNEEKKTIEHNLTNIETICNINDKNTLTQSNNDEPKLKLLKKHLSDDKKTNNNIKINNDKKTNLLELKQMRKKTNFARRF
jgi:hypothetical protein